MRTVNVWVMVAVIGLALVLGVLNNLRVPAERRVTWFGGQQVLPSPEALP